MLEHCTVFYADRLSDSILQAMRTAEAAGAVIFCEPSDFEDGFPFEEALRLATVLKYSEDRLGDRLAGRLIDCVSIVTYGRSAERRGGKEGVSTCRARWPQYHSKKHNRHRRYTTLTTHEHEL